MTKFLISDFGNTLNKEGAAKPGALLAKEGEKI